MVQEVIGASAAVVASVRQRNNDIFGSFVGGAEKQKQVRKRKETLFFYSLSKSKCGTTSQNYYSPIREMN